MTSFTDRCTYLLIALRAGQDLRALDDFVTIDLRLVVVVDCLRLVDEYQLVRGASPGSRDGRGRRHFERGAGRDAGKSRGAVTGESGK